MSALHRIESCVVLVVLFLLPACSVNVKKGATGDDKKVDIDTPVGGIHVSKDVDARDTGLDVYPGARLKPHEDGDHDESANVNISAGPYAIRVIAVQYESDDPPPKVISYYRAQLKRYGTVLECHTSKHNPDVNMDPTKEDDEKLLSCDENGGDNVELKVGTRQNQRIVAVQAEGKGSSFALVRAQTHGKDTI